MQRNSAEPARFERLKYVKGLAMLRLTIISSDDTVLWLGQY